LRLVPGGWVGTAVAPRAGRWNAYDMLDVLAEGEQTE
jgi:hypothetical protein